MGYFRIRLAREDRRYAIELDAADWIAALTKFSESAGASWEVLAVEEVADESAGPNVSAENRSASGWLEGQRTTGPARHMEVV